MLKLIVSLLMCFIIIGCAQDKELIKVSQTLQKAEIGYLYKKFDKEWCPIQVIDRSEFDHLINDNLRRSYPLNFVAAYHLELYSSETSLGELIINQSGTHAKLHLKQSDKLYYLELNKPFNDMLAVTDQSYIPCQNRNVLSNSKEHHIVNMDKVTVREFIKDLPIKFSQLNGLSATEYKNTMSLYMVKKQTAADWMTKDDISYLMTLINSEQPSHCVMHFLSSHLPIGEKSTVGGQVMNIIDAYRFNKPYPNFLTSCARTDKKRQQEILSWWQDYK